MKKLLILTSLATMLASIPTSTAVITNNALANFKDIPKEVLKADENILIPETAKFISTDKNIFSYMSYVRMPNNKYYAGFKKSTLKTLIANGTLPISKEGIAIISFDKLNAPSDSTTQFAGLITPEGYQIGEVQDANRTMLSIFNVYIYDELKTEQDLGNYNLTLKDSPSDENAPTQDFYYNPNAQSHPQSTYFGCYISFNVNDLDQVFNNVEINGTNTNYSDDYLVGITFSDVSTNFDYQDDTSFFEDNRTINPALDTVNLNYENVIQNGGSKDIYIDVDSSVTTAQIVGMVKSKDLFGVDVPVSVVESESTYQPGQVGTFKIVVSATDSYNQTAKATINVHVVDRKAPVITQTSDVAVRYGSKLTQAQILEHFTVIDNADTTPTIELIKVTDGFEFDQALNFGKYSLTIKATDDSNNSNQLTFTVNVYDDVAPTIAKKNGETSAPIVFQYSQTNGIIASEQILSLFSANDAIDGDVSSTLAIKEGELTNTIGDHTLVISAKDRSNNEAVLSITYKVVADIPPVFILDSTLVQTSPEDPLTNEDITKLVVNYLQMGATNVDINEDDYSSYLANSETVGTRNRVRYSFTDVNGKVNDDEMILLVGNTSTTPEQPLNGWDKFWQCFVNFFKGYGWHTDSEIKLQGIVSFYEKLSNWFKGIFNHFDFTCFISDEEYLIKYPENTNTENNSTSLDSSK